MTQLEEYKGLLLVMFALYICWKFSEHKNFDYRCPGCGANNPDQHDSGCPFYTKES
jgi:hypothetical protein